MELYLMQHGLAVPESEDPERPLSVEGQEQIETSAKAMGRMGLRIDVFATSTQKRALQTAEIVAVALGYPTSCIAQSKAIYPKADIEELLGYLMQWKDRESVFVAGHMPSLANAAGFLLCEAEEISIDFQNGGLCCIEAERLEQGAGMLKFYVTPSQLELIAAGP